MLKGKLHLPDDNFIPHVLERNSSFLSENKNRLLNDYKDGVVERNFHSFSLVYWNSSLLRKLI